MHTILKYIDNLYVLFVMDVVTQLFLDCYHRLKSANVVALAGIGATHLGKTYRVQLRPGQPGGSIHIPY